MDSPHRYQLGLFIGRFQPFHNGHLYSLRKAFESAERVIIGIGSSQVSGTETNPWSYTIRRDIVEAVITREGYPPGRWVVQPVPDFPQDADWATYIKNMIDNMGLDIHEVAAVGNNEWTNGILRELGMAIYETGLYNRDELEGVKIRNMIRAQNPSWIARVPPPVYSIISRVQ